MKRILFLVVVFTGLASLTVSFGLEKFVSYTSTTEFCVGCHEMQNSVYVEYQKTTHYKNASGVQPSCSDCHVPKGLMPTLYRKLLAVKDVYHHLVGTIDTPKKFEQRRLMMAQRVWQQLQASDSQTCRSCHNFDHMDFNKQRKRASKQHQNAIKDGSTCINCHKGIAHKAPQEKEQELDDEQNLLELEF